MHNTSTVFRYRLAQGITVRAVEAGAGLLLIGASIVCYRFPQAHFIADCLAVAAAVICGREMAVGAVRGVAKGKLNVAELVTLAMIAALVLGEYLVAAEVAFIMTVGGYLEERVIDRSRKYIRDLAALIPSEARLKSGPSGRMVPLAEIKPGDTVLVKPGEEVPVDGVVTAGGSLVSEANITGESRPVAKMPGDLVYAGSFTFDGALEIKTLKAGQVSTLGRVVELTRKALEEKTPAVRLADRFAAWFTPLVLTLTFLVYILSGDVLRSVAVLVVMCPCTLVLAIPTALAASLGKCVKNGILPKGGVYLEKAAEVDTIILDKTGTLTFGKPKLAGIVPFAGFSAEQLLAAAAVAEKYSNHPIAREIIGEAAQRGLAVPDPEEARLVPGQGMVARSNGHEIVVGSAGLLKSNHYRRLEEALAAASAEERRGRTTFFVALDGEIRGVIALEDTLREETLHSIARLKKLVPRLIMLTGDNYHAAYRAASDTGIFEFKARLLPEDKVNILHELQSRGRIVAAVGDGINDAPLLAGADVGLAMGDSTAQVTLDAGAVVLLKGDFSRLPLFFQIARRTKTVIRQNIVVFAIIYNLAAFFLALFGYLSPLGGAIVHNIGSTLVVLNSVRLLGNRL